jgi:phosphoribosyl-AMP cyclohydrolase
MKLLNEIKFDANGLIPAIIQDAADNQVLTLCYMNRDAVAKTLETGLVHVFRRSRGRLMLKGESSGMTQAIQEVSYDCEGNSLLFKVAQKIAACHTGHKTCYFRVYNPKSDTVEIVGKPLFNPDEVYKKKG